MSKYILICLIIIFTCQVNISCSQEMNGLNDADRERVKELNSKAAKLLMPSVENSEKETSTDSAVYYLKEALSIDSSNKNTILNLSSAYMHKNDYSSSLNTLNYGISIDSLNIDFMYYKSLVLLCLNRESEAVDTLKHLRTLYEEKLKNTDEAALVLNLGYVLFLLDSEQEIKLLIEEYSDENPRIEYMLSQLIDGTRTKQEILPCNTP